MPGIEDWINNPLSVIHNVFERRGSSNSEWVNEVKQYFRQKLSDDEVVKSIPCLNCCPSHTLRPNGLVRFRGMVQDMFEPEFYLGVFEVKDTRTQQIFLRNGRFQDVVCSTPHEEVNLDSVRNVTLDRMTYYCVPVPAETPWVDEINKELCRQYHQGPNSASSGSCQHKRSLEEEEAEDMNKDSDSEYMETDSQPVKKSRAESSRQVAEPQSLSTPVYNSNGVACLVKVYDETTSFALNDVIEFFGVLSVDPCLTYLEDETNNSNAIQSAFLNPPTSEECKARNPPSSLVPRLHILLSRKLPHNNPLLPLPSLASTTALKSELEDVLSDAASVRSRLKTLFEEVLLGDTLAAEYLICHLISSVYDGKETMSLGKFSVNLSSVPTGVDFVQRIWEILQLLTTKCLRLPLTLTCLNNSTFAPKKDYTANKLTTGILQLSPHTHLLVDETSLAPGQLDAKGVQNITELGNLINWQKVDYDFTYHKISYQTNVPVLILSEGKSMLPSDCQIPLRTCDRPLTSVVDRVEARELTLMRCFISGLKLMDYTMSDDLQQIVQEDFVASRQESVQGMTTDDLHSLLVLARLMCLSYGLTKLTKEIWDKTKSMELERKARIST